MIFITACLQVRAVVGEKVDREHASRNQSSEAPVSTSAPQAAAFGKVAVEKAGVVQQTQPRKMSSGSVKIRQADIDFVLKSKALQEVEQAKETSSPLVDQAQTDVPNAAQIAKAAHIAPKAAKTITTSPSDALVMQRFRTSNGSYGAFHHVGAHCGFH